MIKFLRLLKFQKGEIATALTLISFALMVAGTLLGSYIAQRETKTISKAAGYNWDKCQLGACRIDFDGTTADNGWCQGNKIRCQRYNGKVCQLPDPWCDRPDQGPASTCTGVHQKDTDTSQTCTSVGKNNGDNICEPPNENWETNPACPYVLPGGAPPPGASGTQCSDEGGLCVQTTGVCQASYGTVDEDKGCKAYNQYMPVCCKIYPTSTPTTPAGETCQPHINTSLCEPSGIKTVYFSFVDNKWHNKADCSDTCNSLQDACNNNCGGGGENQPPPQANNVINATITVTSQDGSKNFQKIRALLSYGKEILQHYDVITPGEIHSFPFTKEIQFPYLDKTKQYTITLIYDDSSGMARVETITTNCNGHTQESPNSCVLNPPGSISFQVTIPASQAPPVSDCPAGMGATDSYCDPSNLTVVKVCQGDDIPCAQGQQCKTTGQGTAKCETIQSSSVPPGTIRFQVNITVGNQKYDNIAAYACPDRQCTSNDWKWVLDTEPNPRRLLGGSHSKDFGGLTDNIPYHVFVHVYLNNKVVYSSQSQTVTPPKTAQFDISLQPLRNIPELSLSYTAANYKKVIDGFLQGTYSALQISEWVSKATYTPGIKIQTCDPMKGECDMPI